MEIWTYRRTSSLGYSVVDSVSQNPDNTLNYDEMKRVKAKFVKPPQV